MWETDLTKAVRDADRCALNMGQTTYVLTDGGNEEQDPVYLVTRREPGTFPPGAFIAYVARAR